MEIKLIDRLPKFVYIAIIVVLAFFVIKMSCHRPQPALTDNGQKERKAADSLQKVIDTANATAITKADNHVTKAKEAVKRANLPRKVIVEPSVEQMGVDLINWKSE